MSALSPINFRSPDSFPVLDRDTALAFLHKGNYGNGQHCNKQEQNQIPPIFPANKTGNLTGELSHNAPKNENRDPIPNALFGNQFTQPDRNHRPCCHGNQDSNCGEGTYPKAKVVENARYRTLDKDNLTVSLEQS